MIRRVSQQIRVVLGAVALLLTLPIQAYGQANQGTDRVRDIQNNPGQFEDEVVTIEGFVTEYQDENAQTTRFYYLKDSYGDIIMVRTTGDFPTVGERYRVSGPVSIDPEMNRPYVSEESRARLSGGGDGGGGAEQETAGQEAEAGGVSVETILFAAIGVVVLLLLGLLIYVLYQRRQPQPAPQGGSSLSADTPPPTSGDTEPSTQEGSGQDKRSAPATGQAPSEETPEPEGVVQDKTVKMHVPPDNTLKLLGSLEVVAGLDDIERIPLHRPPNQDGREAEITIGRADGPPYEHIELKPRTVSSKQAKLIYDGDCQVVNYASEKSNPTRVNGEPMDLNESAKIEDGDVLTMGEVKLRYSEDLT